MRNPNCNGQTERFNRTLIRMIKAYLKDEQTIWDLNLGCLAGAYRASPNESTQLTPNLLFLGREVRIPTERLIGSAPVCKGEVLSYGDYVDQLRERLKRAHSVACKNIGKSSVKQKDRYDVKVYQTLYEVGDYWYLAETCRPGRCPKLNRDFEGPYVITKKLNPLDFQIQVDRFGTSKPVHHDRYRNIGEIIRQRGLSRCRIE